MAPKCLGTEVTGVTFNQVVRNLAGKRGSKSPVLLAKVITLGRANVTPVSSVKYVLSLTPADRQRYQDAVNDAVI